MRFKSLFLAVISTVSFSVFAQASSPASSSTVPPKPQASLPQAFPADAPKTTETSTSLSNNTDRMSYSIGVDIGRNFKSQNIDLNADMIAQGIKDGLSNNNKYLMTPKEMQETLMNFQKDLIAKRQAMLQQVGEKNRTESASFLEANKKKEGVVTLKDGLQYKILKEGSGESPKATDVVTVNYEGTFPNGQVFDSSYARGKPSSFPVNAVIPGWTEALMLMKPGAEWMLYIPSDLAYGDHGQGPIAPNQALVFKVQLISVQSGAKTSAQATTENKNATGKK